MAVSTITSIKKVIGYKGSTKKDSETSIPKDDSLALVPTVGFRVGYKMGTTKLQVLVLGARHLPAKVGMTRVFGYTVKVCTSNTELQASQSLYLQRLYPLPPGTYWIGGPLGSAADLDLVSKKNPFREPNLCRLTHILVTTD